MIQRPLIVGSKGSMGRRYAAILQKMGIRPQLVDVGDQTPKSYDGVIIASPTALHAAHIEQFLPLGIPILCEKPFTTSLRRLEPLLTKIDKAGAQVDMVNQYRYLVGTRSEWGSDFTLYNYFNHGRDGLPWDCISVIGLAKEMAVLGEDSPVWTCILNGHTMRLSDMDEAYIAMIDRWVKSTLTGHGLTYIRDAHARVQAYIEANA